MFITLFVTILIIPSVGIIIWFFVSTIKAFNKFAGLDKSIREKLLLIEYYMAFVRNLSTEELIKVGKLSDEEIIKFNGIHDWNERIKTAREKISS
jgi:hypothetical protein